MEERKKVTVRVDVGIGRKDISDLLATALYDGITYWCPKFRTVDMKKKEGDDRCYEDKVADHLFNGGKVTFYEDEDESGIEEDFIAHTVGIEDFLEGIRKYLLERGRNVITEVIESGNRVSEIDWGDIDAFEADAMIQYICFGEVIYG
jgi:hypothetical protein